jgi:hypothetical protein
MTDKNRENRIRRLARQHAYVLRKSRVRKYHEQRTGLDDIEVFFGSRKAS